LPGGPNQRAAGFAYGQGRRIALTKAEYTRQGSNLQPSVP
jgi:hypothetical protein